MRAILFAGLAAATVVLIVVQQVVAAQTGPLPMVSVFELHLLVLAGVLAIGALVGSLGSGRAGAPTRLVALGVLVIVLIRAGGELWSSAEPAAGDQVTVLSWNLEVDSKSAEEAVEGIAAIEADLVALQELTPTYAQAIEDDPTLTGRYAYRILDPREGSLGMGLLSRLPLVLGDNGNGPNRQHAGWILPGGRTVEVLNVHPRRPLYRTVGPVPVALNTKDRDEDILAIRATIDSIGSTDRTLVVGDLNGSSTEPGLAPLRDVLSDAHESAGRGPGFTWRPEALEPFGFGVLRIDHVLSGSWLRPVETSVDCEATGDHCRLLVTLEVVEPD